MADQTTITKLPPQIIGDMGRKTTRPPELRLQVAAFSTSRYTPNRKVVKSLKNG